MFKVSDFLSHFNKHNDFAKTSKFDVRINAPKGLTDLSIMKDLRFQCETTELPGYSINAVDNRLYGVSTPVASAPTSFSDITLTFICAGDMWERKVFDRWMNFIVPINNYNVRYKEDYCSDISINQYTDIAASDKQTTISSEQQLIYSIKLFNAFPISTGAMGLNWADDNFHRLTVTFKYDYWLPNFNINAPIDIQNKQTPASGSTPPIGTSQNDTRGNFLDLFRKSY